VNDSRPPSSSEAEIRARLAAIIDSADDAIISKDLNGIVESWNRGAERILGYTAEEMVGRPIAVIAAPGHEAEMPRILDTIRRGGRVDHFETKRRRKDGTVIDVALTVSPVRDANGRVVGASKVLRDITERKALELDRAALAAIVHSCDEAIVSTDERGLVRSWNAAAERLFGYRSDEVLGRHVSLLAPSGREDDLTNRLAIALGGEPLDHVETVRRRKDGSLVDVSVTISPVCDPAGRIVGASKILRDISDRKRAEADRAALLERERVARRDAEQASRLKDEFLATLSHELRTPLSAILGWTHLLRTTTPDRESLAKGLEIVERNARVQASIVEDLLGMSRILAGRMRLEVRPIDLVGVVAAAIDTAAPGALAKGVALRPDLGSTPLRVLGDAERLQQVFWNVLSNAVKFTPRGGRVDVRMTAADSNVEVVVSDTGQGIPIDFLPHVFERFRQAEASPSRRHGGLGIGLAIVKQLVELHGGSVSAESPGPDLGATIVVRLPEAIDGGAAAFGMAGAPESFRGAEAASLRGIRVLVVDDEPDSLSLTSRLLNDRGASVLEASSAEEGLSKLRTGRPDVLVSDIAMPGDDGYVLIREVRRLGPESGGRTPALALTAFAGEESRRRALSEGYARHLAKPVEAATLVAAVADLAGRPAG